MVHWMLLAACTGDINKGKDDTGEVERPERYSLINLDTRDGETLEADFIAAFEADRPGVVLLHMNPESNDRTNWPVDFVNELAERNWGVIVPDRRGTGGSTGTASAAFLGDAGRYDVEACVNHLLENGARNISIVAASNGTTSALDYAVWGPTESLPAPLAMVFMTGGNYTENNTEMSALSIEHALFTYSTAEKAWSEMQTALDPGTWQFNEYSDGDHGTRMFDAVPEVSQEIEDWLATRLG
jgi:pimeloyl-ACP methyl ester carboxylesterase